MELSLQKGSDRRLVGDKTTMEDGTLYLTQVPLDFSLKTAVKRGSLDLLWYTTPVAALFQKTTVHFKDESWT